MERRKNGGQSANMHLHAPDFHAKIIYALDALNDHVCFQLFDDGRKYYILSNYTQYEPYWVWLETYMYVSLGMGLLQAFTGHGHTTIQQYSQLFKYEKIQCDGLF